MLNKMIHRLIVGCIMAVLSYFTMHFILTNQKILALLQIQLELPLQFVSQWSIVTALGTFIVFNWLVSTIKTKEDNNATN